MHAQSASTSVLAGAAAGAAAAVVHSGEVRTSDQMSLTYRLETAAGRTVSSDEAKRRAEADGEDVLTPMIETVAETVASLASTR